MPSTSSQYWYAQSFEPDESYIKNIMVQVRWESTWGVIPWVSVYLVESLNTWGDPNVDGDYIVKKDSPVPLKNTVFPVIMIVSDDVDTSKTYWIVVRPKSYTEDKDTLYVLASLSTNPYSGGVLKRWDETSGWLSDSLSYDMAFIVSTEGETEYVTCYQCQNGEIVDDEFENSCPTGWTLTPPYDCEGNGDGVTVKIWAKDSSSTLLEDAEITLADSVGNAIKRTTTGTGFVRFLNTPAGSYTVTGELAGYITTGGNLTVGNTDIEETLTFTPGAIPVPGFEALLFMVSLLGVVFIVRKKWVKM